jgi:hypothetical protein
MEVGSHLLARGVHKLMKLAFGRYGAQVVSVVCNGRLVAVWWG